MSHAYALPPAELVGGPERVVLSDGRVALTRGELDRRVAELARELAATPAGTVVGLRRENVPAYLVAVLACLEARRTLVLIDLHWRPQEWAHARVEAPIDLLLTGPGTLEREQAARAWSCAEWLCGDDGALVGSRPEVEPAERDPAERAALVLWSSGTTGLPKPIGIDREQLAVRARCQTDNVPHGPGDVTLCALPLSHCHGIECLSLPTLAAGGVLCLMDPLAASPAAVARAVDEWGVTCFSALPRFWAELAELDLEPGALGSLRLALCGSAALTVEVAERVWERFGLRIAQGYGLTEVGVIAVDRDRPPRLSFGTVGPVFEGLEWRVDGADADGIGELCVRSAGCTRLDEDGWLHTRDLVRVDAHGRLAIVGRMASFLNLNGAKADPVEIERAVETLPWVTECAVRGIVGDDGVERPAAWVAPRPGPDQPQAADLVRAAVAERLAVYKVPTTVVFLDALPRSSIGKFEYAKLPDPEPTPVRGAPRTLPRDALERRIAARWAEILGLDEVGVDEGFLALGGTSLGVARLATELEQEFERPVALVELFRHPTVATQAAWLGGRASADGLGPATERGARQAEALRAAARRRERRG